MTGHPRRDRAMAASLRRVAQGAHGGEIVLQTSAVYLLGANRMHGAAAVQAAVPVMHKLKRAAQEKALAYSARAEAARRANARQRQRVIKRSELAPPPRRRTEPTRKAEPTRPPQPPRRRDEPSDGRSRRPER